MLHLQYPSVAPSITVAPNTQGELKKRKEKCLVCIQWATLQDEVILKRIIRPPIGFHFIAILYEHCVQTFVWMYVSILGGHIPRSGLPGGSVGKYLPAMWEIWVQSLGWEDPLEMGKTTHSSILVWRIPWTV